MADSKLMSLMKHRLRIAARYMTDPNTDKQYLGRLAARGLRDIVDGKTPMPNVPQHVVDRDYDRMNQGQLEGLLG